MRIAVFTYNFPHKKTQDFLLRLFLEEADVRIVLAADPVKLAIPPTTVRTKIRFGGLVHPRMIAERCGWRYQVVEHNDPLTAKLLRDEQIDAAIIAGARVLKEPVISATRLGIVNFHPGLIPEVRGLDAMQWALAEGHPLGVTAHVIDRRVDAGRVLLRREIGLLPDDTLFDVAQRLMDTQIDMLPQVLQLLSCDAIPELVTSAFPLHRKMPPELEQKLSAILEQRIRKLHPFPPTA